MATPTTQTTIIVKICLENLRKSIYAESAWRFATRLSDGTDSPLLSTDRQRITDEFIATAFADIISALSAYTSAHNLCTFRTDEMLSMELSYKKPAISAQHRQSLGTTISQALTARVLNLCYPADSIYATRYQKARRSILTAFAIHEQ